MKYQAGDVVEVQAVVKWEADDKDRLYLTIDGQTVGVPFDSVVLVHHGFKVGDAATYKPTLNEDAPYNVNIIAIHDKQAWVDGDWAGIVDLYELKRPEPEVASEEGTDINPSAPALAPIGDAGVILPASDEVA